MYPRREPGNDKQDFEGLVWGNRGGFNAVKEYLEGDGGLMPLECGLKSKN